VKTAGAESLASNDALMKQLMNPTNFINTDAFLSAKLTQKDVENHCYILQSVIQVQKTP